MSTDKQVPAVAGQGGAPAVYDYTKYAGQGFEGHTAADYTMPFLTVLEGLSPQLETVEGAKPGIIINTVTNELFPNGINFVAAGTQHKFVEWLPDRGGMVAQHDPESKFVQDVLKKHEEDGGAFGKLKTPDDNDLVETFYVWGVALDDKLRPMFQAGIAFGSTRIRKYKAWMTKARYARIADATSDVPLFALAYQLKAIDDSNKKGKFHNWGIEFIGNSADKAKLGIDSPAFKAALDVLKTISKGGTIKAAYDTTKQSGAEEENIPF